MPELDFLHTLHERGFIQQISDEPGLHEALTQPITLYCGYDPTADSLTAGHLLSILLLCHAQRAGHRPICLAGGATGLIGDPTGKSATRPHLTLDGIAHNLSCQGAQLARILDFTMGRALLVNNTDWLGAATLLEFLRAYGHHFPVSGMLAAETYATRLGAGLTFAEFSYMLLQAVDFLHLYQSRDCMLQVGGSDQWANSLAGADLIRRVTGGSAYVLVTPLLTTSSGAKMGKTAAGAIWLDPARTSPYDFFQYWVNVKNADVERFLALFTFLPMDEVRRLGALEGADLRHAKQVLAYEVTRLVHGEAAATSARHAAAALFGGSQAAADTPTTRVTLSARAATTVLDLLVMSGLSESRSAGRRLISQGGVTLDGALVEDPDTVVTKEALKDSGVLLRAGKKRYHRFVLAAEVPS